MFSLFSTFTVIMFLLLLCYTVLLSEAYGQNCSEHHSINISSGVLDKHKNTITHEGVVYTEDLYYKYNGTIRGCICQIKTCIKSCCPDGEAKLNGTCQEHDWKLRVNVYNGTTLMQKNADYHVISYKHDCKGAVLKGNEFHIQKDGKLMFTPDFFNFENYCLTTYTNRTDLAQAHICYEAVKVTEDVPGRTNTFGMMISIPLLIATLIVFSLLPPSKWKVGTRSQMAYVLSLTCAYLFLVIIQMNRMGAGACKTLATLCLYSFMSSFCWMNISCIDIYWTFSGKRGYRRALNNGRSKKFYLKCLYAYGFPLALVSVIFVINTLDDISLWFHPNFGVRQCWLGEGYPHLLYFYGPMGILLVCNVTLFLLTAFKIRQLDRESSMVRKDGNEKHYENDKQRFNVYFKLLLALGINWALEFISWMVDWGLGSKYISPIWFVTDLCNALYGVFIFYMFVCKKSIWIMLKKRYYICTGQPQKAKMITTISTNFQTKKKNNDGSTVSTKV